MPEIPHDSEIFDRRLRRVRRDRAACLSPQYDVLGAVRDDLLDRLDSIKRDFTTALVINAAPIGLIEALRARGMNVTCADPGHEHAKAAGGVQSDEDRPAFDDASFDLIINIGLLDSVNDVPGALALMRRTLKPDGLMLCAFAGAGSLDTLRTMLREIDPATQRTHPQIDVRAGGDLLARAGFVLPVADADALTLRYESLPALLSDLRAHAASNLLIRRAPLSCAHYRALIAASEMASPLSEMLNIITLTGWAPSQKKL